MENAPITPIFKDGDKTDKSNYHPISILLGIPRLFEKIVFDQSYQCLIENKFIYPGQSGFLKINSTLTCLLRIADDWYNGLHNGEMVGSVFIDLKKVFDTVDHVSSLQKIRTLWC